ncbi:MAG: gliding motility-associated C-terminal domain-containing protein [Bacteroidales bacterium]|nr:gliding motility-associated C-terminal domain-containing protein [Bacteroidales bacterium]
MRKLKTIFLISALLFFSNAVSGINGKNESNPEVFIQNKGQLIDFDKNLHGEILYYYQSKTLDIYFRAGGLTYIFKKGNDIPWKAGASDEEQVKLFRDFMNDSTLYYRLDVNFENAGSEINLFGEGGSGFYSNYYYPHCPNGIFSVEHFSKIRYSNVYDGVDFVYFLKDGKLKYDIEVRNPYSFHEIALKFDGAKNIKLIKNELHINSPVGEIVETLPKSYFQNTNEEIDVFYELNDDVVLFNSEQTLDHSFVIDPEISWTSFYDDSFWNGSNVAVDVKGDQFVIVNYGFNSNLPTLNPGGSAYFQNTNAGSGDYKILKFDTNGVRIWVTYYGGSDYENTPDVVIDYNDNIIVVGQCESTDIPVQNAGGYYDATYNTLSIGDGGTAILRFNSSGVRNWATHYDYVQWPDVDVDQNNNIYVVGNSEYDNPPVQTLSGAYNQATVSNDASGTSKSDDIFIIKFNSSTSRTWATNLGSTSDEFASDIHVGSDNYLNILGYGDNYYGTGIVTQNPGGGAYYDNTLGIGSGGSSTDRDDALIYRFNTSGALIWGTAFSGTLAENMQNGRITCDNSNNVIIYGETRSTDLPVLNPGGGAYYDGTFTASSSNFNPFLARFSTGGVLNWCTYFGTYGLGFGMNMSSYVGVTSDDKLIVIATEGGGVPGTFPLVPRTGDYNATLSVYMGVYVAEFSSTLSLDWSTYYAGATDRNMLGDAAITDDACGYAIYMVSNWQEFNVAATDPPWVQPTPSSYQNTVHSTVGDGSGLITRLSSLPPDATITAAGPFCISDGSTSLTAATSGGTWSGTGVSSGGVFDPSAAGVGTHTIYYTISGSCGAIDSLDIDVVALANATITPAGPFCETDVSVALSAATGGGTWSGTGVSVGGNFDPNTAGPGTHEIIYTISGSCGSADTIDVIVEAMPDATITPVGPFCSNDPAVTLVVADTGGVWSGSGVNSSGVFDPSIAGAGTQEIIYTISGTCSDADTIDIIVTQAADATITPAGPYCISDASEFLSAVDAGGTWSGTGVDPVTGEFDPSIAGNGTHDIVYTISGACGDADTISILVYTQADASITAAGPYCDQDSVFTLLAATPGGTWSGSGITSTSAGTFNPNTAGIGTHTITYSISGACGDTATTVIEVYRSQELDAIVTIESCNTALDASIDLSVSYGNNPFTYYWSNGAGTQDLSSLGDGTYSVTVTDVYGCEVRDSYVVDESLDDCDGTDPHAVVPNAFSPNGDGENDMLFVRGKDVAQLNFIIYDRWGEKVFETQSLNIGWDGTFRGKELDPGVFVYYMHAIFTDGSEKIEKGDITLVK